MGAALLEFAISTVLVVVAAIWLTKCADTIAEKTRLGRLIVGTILLAGATSLPELMIGVHAIRFDLPDIAVGDLVGSCLINLLILGVADSFLRKNRILITAYAAHHALNGLISVSLAAVAGLFILVCREIETYSLLRLGPGSITLLVIYVLGMRLVYVDQRIDNQNNQPDGRLEIEYGTPLTRAVIGYLLGAGLIFVAAPYVSHSSGILAEKTGLGQTFFGTTIVAVVTSLPEVATTFAAIRMRVFDLAIGNIFGSNTFNLLLIAPLDAMYGGTLLQAVSVTHAITCFWIVLVSTIVLIGQLYRVERRVLFLEPEATLVIALVIIALLVVYLVR